MTHSILEFLHGKKASIVALWSLTTSFLVLKQVIDIDTATYLDSAILVISFGADYKTKKMLGTTRK